MLRNVTNCYVLWVILLIKTTIIQNNSKKPMYQIRHKKYLSKTIIYKYIPTYTENAQVHVYINS